MKENYIYDVDDIASHIINVKVYDIVERNVGVDESNCLTLVSLDIVEGNISEMSEGGLDECMVGKESR